MAALFGKVDEFEESKEDWPQYLERLNHYFLANDVATAGKKRAVFVCHRAVNQPVAAKFGVAGKARREIV